MTIDELFAPVVTFLEWCRTYEIVICGYSFTWFEMWTYTIIATIVLQWLYGILTGE